MNAGFARRVGNSNLIKNDEKGCLFFPAGMASSWQDFGEEGFLFCLFISRSLRPKKQKCRSVMSLEKWLVLYQCMYGFFQHTSLFCETAYYITFRNCVTTTQTIEIIKLLWKYVHCITMNCLFLAISPQRQLFQYWLNFNSMWSEDFSPPSICFS